MRRQRDDRKPARADGWHHIRPVRPGVRHTEDSAHRGTNRLSIQGIGAGAIEDHAVDAECRRIAKDPSDVVGVGDRLQHHDEPAPCGATPSHRIPVDARRGDTAAMDVEAGDLAERLDRTDIDGHARVEALERTPRVAAEPPGSKAIDRMPYRLSSIRRRTTRRPSATKRPRLRAPDRGRRRSHTRQFGRHRRPAAS